MKEPRQASKEDENQMFLVYSDKIYNLQKDKEKPSDTLIEISNKRICPSKLPTVLLARIYYG